MITQFIKSNYIKAVKKQQEMSHDISIVKSVQTKSLSAEEVINWMQSYALFQGIEGQKRIAMALEYIQFVIAQNPTESLNIEKDFNTLHTRLYFASGNRKCLSAATKLLWCMYPNDIVIYDAFVARSILILQCLDRDMASMDRIDVPPKKSDDSTPMTQYYLSFHNLVMTLFNKHKETLIDLRASHPHPYPYDIRIFDKLLWMMGSFGKK